MGKFNISNKIRFYTTAVLLLLIGCVGFGYYQFSSSCLPGTDLIRFHVIANSDSPYDQQLKLKVRDAVIGYLAADLAEEHDPQRAQEIIKEKIPEIQAVSRTVLAGAADYDAQVQLGEYPFPTRNYGEFVLPAGNYEALRIVLGDGAGKNWWCVLFPPLCFVDVTGNIAQTPVTATAGTDSVAASGGYLTVKLKTVEMFHPDENLAIVTSGPVRQ